MYRISHSKLSLARSCWKKFYFRYVKKYKPISDSIEVSLGRAVHEASDMHRHKKSADDIVAYLSKLFDDKIANQEVADRESVEIAKWTAIAMWLNYPYKNIKYESETSEEYKEKKGAARGICFVWKPDGKVKNNGVWWLREMKVTGLYQRQFEGRCNTSAQCSMYCLCEKLDATPVAGMMYEWIRRPLLRKGVKENSSEFCRRIARDYADRPEYYYGRYFTYRNDVQLQQYFDDMKDTVKEICRREKSGSYPRNLDQCWNYAKECPYMKICEKEDPFLVNLYYTIGGDENGPDGTAVERDKVEESG